MTWLHYASQNAIMLRKTLSIAAVKSEPHEFFLRKEFVLFEIGSRPLNGSDFLKSIKQKKLPPRLGDEN